MSILKDLQKSFKSHHLIALLGVVILIAALSQYSGRKGSAHEGADSNHQTAPEYLTAEERFAKESPAQQQQFYDAAAGASAQAVQMSQRWRRPARTPMRLPCSPRMRLP